MVLKGHIVDQIPALKPRYVPDIPSPKGAGHTHDWCLRNISSFEGVKPCEMYKQCNFAQASYLAHFRDCHRDSKIELSHVFIGFSV